jgi:hypothetical protein
VFSSLFLPRCSYAGKAPDFCLRKSRPFCCSPPGSEAWSRTTRWLNQLPAELRDLPVFLRFGRGDFRQNGLRLLLVWDLLRFNLSAGLLASRVKKNNVSNSPQSISRTFSAFFRLVCLSLCCDSGHRSRSMI